jgi:Ca-activated chloride channel family protein
MGVDPMRRIGVSAVAVTGLLLAACAGAGSGDGSGDTGWAPDHPAPDGQTFADYGINPEVATAENHRSTFALDVDTGSYTVARSRLREGRLPDPAAVRTEEFVNFFRQDYQPPADGIGIHVDGTAVPFLPEPGTRVLRVGLQAAVVEAADRPPANLTFVVDTSGSMEGPSLEMVQAGLSRLVDSLRPDDRVAIVSYSDQAGLRLPMTPRSEEAAIRRVIAELAPQASTNLEAGLRVGYEQARANLRGDGINRVILLSDGAANVGQTDPGTLAEQIAQEAGDDTQLVVVGVGRQTYNEAILEQFADRGNGFYAYIDTVREAERLFVHDLTGTLQVVALDAKVQVSFDPAAVSHYRLLGYENRQLAAEDLRDDTVDGGEVGAGHTVTALYQITLAGGGGAGPAAALATVQVRWTDPERGQPLERSATITAGDLVGSFPLAPPRLRQDILVAAFAESLRGAPWSQRVSRDEIAAGAELLSLALPDDPEVAELAELTRIAADYSG